MIDGIEGRSECSCRMGSRLTIALDQNRDEIEESWKQCSDCHCKRKSRPPLIASQL